MDNKCNNKVSGVFRTPIQKELHTPVIIPAECQLIELKTDEIKEISNPNPESDNERK